MWYYLFYDNYKWKENVITIHQELAKLASIPKDDYDCETFWREYGNVIPNLAILARTYLTIGATSVPSSGVTRVGHRWAPLNQ